uniref:Progesterone-induced-blocking factor 1-like n=1 Tax=Erpetoichthys calabaricus TaxID=27687 RepID=A0A8C4SS98_ERPCA
MQSKDSKNCSSTFIETKHFCTETEETHLAEETISNTNISSPLFDNNVQLLKSELYQQNLTNDNLHVFPSSKLDQSEDKFDCGIPQILRLTKKAGHEQKVQQAESRKEQNYIRDCMNVLFLSQTQLEETNQQQNEKARGECSNIHDPAVTQKKSSELKDLLKKQESNSECIPLQFYKEFQPLKTEISTLYSKNIPFSDQFLLKAPTESRKGENKVQPEVEVRRQGLDLELKIEQETYDEIKQEKATLLYMVPEFSSKLDTVKNAQQTTNTESNSIRKELAALQQMVALQQQVNNFQNLQFNISYADNANRIGHLQNETPGTQKFLKQLYKKYKTTGVCSAQEYESKLFDKPEKTGNQSNEDIYNFYSASLDDAVQENEQAFKDEKDTVEKYNMLLEQFMKIWIRIDRKLVELLHGVKQKSQEVDNALMIHEEIAKNMQLYQTECEKHQKKLEVLAGEFSRLHVAAEQHVNELQVQNSEYRVKLSAFEKLEQYFSEATMQNGTIKKKKAPGNILFSNGHGTNVRTTPKKGIKNSACLAKRLLEVEKENSIMRKHLEQQKKLTDQFSQELEEAHTLINQAQQPYHYLIKGICFRENQNQMLKEHILQMENKISTLKKENLALQQIISSMADDLVILLNNCEELLMM